MTPENIAAFFAGLVTLVASLGALITSLRVARKIDKDSTIKDSKLQEIHVLVNSRLSRALKEISELRALIAERSGDPTDKLLAAKADLETRK